jgi:hypothetical protein
MSISNVNEQYFIDCITPESAYVLGFLWGDGYLSKRNDTNIKKKQIWNIATECVKTDLDEIEYLFHKSGKWSSSTRHRINRQEQKEIKTCNKKLYLFLESHNYGNKSYSLPTILNIIPNDLKHYWWRGYSDADGCIYYNEKIPLTQHSITANIDYDWTFYFDLMKDLNINYRLQKIERKQGKHSTVTISSRKGVIDFCKYIYSGENFGLSRKKEKYEKILARWIHLS